MADILITPLESIERPALAWDTHWIADRGQGDWSLSGPAPENPMGLTAVTSIATAVILSLFTDRRAPEGWRPDIRDRRGWWGDGVQPDGEALDPLGSWLWLLETEIVSPQTVALAKAYASAALEWMLRDHVAARIDVTSEARSDGHGVNLGVNLFAASGARIYSGKFDVLWRQVR